ncbi:MAG: hypothetical protein ACYC7K_00505 [Desulfobacteria bacterium]
METRSGELQRIGFVLLAFALAFLACGAAYASDVERRIPVIRDTAGSGLTIDISREGTRQTATSFLTLNDPTVRRIEDRIAKMAAGLAAKVTPAEETVADAVPRIGLTGTSREGSGRTETTLSSLPPLPGEITIRNVKNFLKALRVSLKEKPAPTVAVAVPEQRLGMADTSQH